MSAREMQLLMQQIAEKERSLEEVASEAPWWLTLREKSAPTSEAWWPVTLTVVLVGCLTAAPGLAILIGARFVTPVPTAGELRQVVGGAPEIPWRHYVGREQDQRCDVWVSVLGLAEAECDGKTVYRGFGVVDHDGSFRSLPLDEDTRFDHDVQRSAIIDVRRREAHFGAPVSFDVTDLKDESLQGPPPASDWPSPGVDVYPLVEHLVAIHVDEIRRCGSPDGWLSLHVEIDGRGHVTSATVHDSTVVKSVGRCVTGAVRKWRFPVLGMEWQIEIPFEFAD